MKRIVSFALIAALSLALCACGGVSAQQGETTQVQPAAEGQIQPVEDAQPEEAQAPTGSGRQDGERFESTIILEGMEETVSYEHIVNSSLGIAMDYDYNNFLRQSDGTRERFISVWDDPAAPENYMDVTASSQDAETATAAIVEQLSQDFDITRQTVELDYAGECTWIEASVIKGTNNMSLDLTWVYIIPAPDGCRIATLHAFAAESEGFSRRFAYMLSSLEVLARSGAEGLTDEQALAAIRSYCMQKDPSLEGIVNGGEYEVYWEIADSDAQQIVVLYRSYSAALIRYYIDRATGETTVTELVPGIIDEEQQTEETLNVWDYLG